MSWIKLWTFDNGVPEQLAVEPCPGRHLGLGRVPTTDPSSFKGRMLNGVLGELGHIPIAKRIPYILPAANIDNCHREFLSMCMGGRTFDRAVVLARPEVGEIVALLTERQVSLFGKYFDSAAECVLPNGQIVLASDPNVEADRTMTIEVQPIRFISSAPQPSIRARETPLQAAPSVEFSPMMGRSHSYHCVLNPQHREGFGDHFVAVRNPAFAEDNPSCAAEIGVVPKYDSRVPLGRIILDETTMLAIGLPYGERVAIRPTQRPSPVLRTRIFGYRHCLCRVTRTGIEYMEKPLARVPQSVFDVLGIAPHDRITIEHHPRRDGARVVSLRAILATNPSKQLESRMRNDAPDFEEAVGTEDLPGLQIDLQARKLLGISPGDVVYVRPSVPGVLTREFSSISLLFAATIFSAASFRNVEIAAAALTMYLFIALFVVIRRLR